VLPPVRELTEEERELVDVRVIWAGSSPDNATLIALRALDPHLRDEPIVRLVAALRTKGYHSLGVHQRFYARYVADDARLRGLQVVVTSAH
jgi:hypothetical protein